MRAVCERCEQLQPTDWKPGDLCVHCGEAARHEVRCAWCAKWTPFATYCRNCGSEVVAENQYGAARMLKDAGVDRFTIPKQLTTLDPGQLDNFSRIYQRHAIVVARHVEQLAFLQRYLRQQHWAAALDDELIPQLPWPDSELQRVSSSPIELTADGNADAASTAAEIQAATPFDTTRRLAAVARLRLDDWTAFESAGDAFVSADPTVRDEAVLALTSWRVERAVGRFEGGRAVAEALRASHFPLEASVRLAAMGADDVEITADALTSPDRETSLGAAMVVGDVDRIEAALDGDVIERMAAGAALAQLGATGRLAPLLHDGPDDVRTAVLQALAYARRPAIDLTGALVDLAVSTTNESVRELAAPVAAPTLNGGDALRIARAANGERRILQSLMQRTELPPEAVANLLDYMIEQGLFSAQQYGMSTLVENGRIADTFVPARFGAAAEETRSELLRLAEMQLKQRGDEDLHRFVIGVVFGPIDGKVRTEAWWVLHRWYQQQGDYRGEGPLRLDEASVQRFFGSLDAFLPGLIAMVHDIEALNEVAFGDLAANLFRSAEPALITAIQNHGRLGRELVDALIAAAEAETRTNTNEAIIVLLSQLGTLPAWRDDALAALRRVDRTGNYHYDKAVLRLVLAEFGIPTEDHWGELPIDFVPQHFDQVSVAGQLHLLDVAEHQLIHLTTDRPDTALLEFLAGVAARDSAVPEIHMRAVEIYQERKPYDMPSYDRPDT